MLQTEPKSLLKIDPEIFQKVRNAASDRQLLSAATRKKLVEDLREHLCSLLQAAIELEHCTIPVYLTALYSLQRGSNPDVYKIIFSVVREEMLHMVIAANVLNAVGGSPAINQRNFIPEYPGFLPKIDNVEVNLAPLSMDVVSNTLVQIEKPDKPIHYDSILDSSFQKEESFPTIGEFYQAIIDVLQKGGESWIVGNPDFQVVNAQWFPSDELFAIKTVEDAVNALKLIMQQGEGTNISPEDQEGDYAHYYRFEQIIKGHYLCKDPRKPNGYSYTGATISLDQNKVWNLVKNSKAAYYKPGSVARRMVDEFNYSYTSLLNGLHKTFNGEPNYLNTVMGSMFELKLQAERMVEKKIPDADWAGDPSLIAGKDQYIAPSFEYAPMDR